MTIWSQLKHFKQFEAWGEPSHMRGYHLLSLDAIANTVKAGNPAIKFIVHCAFTTTGHSKDSRHYWGDATDFHVEGIPFVEAYRRIQLALVALQLSDVCGFGVYPEWHNAGFHFDTRGTLARWGHLFGNYCNLAIAMEYAYKQPHLTGA